MANPRSNLDELVKDPKAAGLLESRTLLQGLVRSPNTQRLMELPSQNTGDGLKTAIAKGDTGVLLDMVRQVIQGNEGVRLVQSINQTVPKERKQAFRRERAGDMAGFEERLNAILSDPQTISQIASLAQTLTGEHAGESVPPPAAEPAEAGSTGEAAGQFDATDQSTLLGMLGDGGGSNPLSALSGLDPQLL